MASEKHITICPETGQVLETDPRWTRRKEGNYTYSYTKVGEAVVYVCNSGNVKYFDLQRHAAMIKEFVAAMGVSVPYVEIRDFKEVTGRGSPRQIRETRAYIVENQENLAGYILCNMPFWIHTAAKMGFKAHDTPVRYVSCQTYADAVTAALDILADRAVDLEWTLPPLSMDQVIFKPGWQYTSADGKLMYKSGVIPGQLFFSAIRADFTADINIMDGVPALEQVFRDGGVKGSGYLRIVDYSRTKNMPIRARREYVRVLHHLYKTYNAFPRVTYICGGNIFVRSSIKIFAGFLKQKFKFVDTVEQALSDINSRGLVTRYTARDILVSPRDIAEINELCGMMLWPEEDRRPDVQVDISPENPLKDLSDTLRIVQEDLAVLRKSQRDHITSVEKARQAAEEASKAKSDFLANMSHEIRTPMNGVIGMLDILRDTGLTSSQVEFVELARHSAHGLLGIVNDILDFSKIESGKFSLESVEFDLQDLVDTIGDVLAVKAHKKGVEFGCLITDQVPVRIISDPGRLRQVLLNLVKNAITFVEKGEVFVRVSPEPARDDDRTTLRFEVRDTGIGIPKEKQHDLFEAFTQVDTSTTRRYGGTGLGLAISRQLVDLMGGTIGLDSAPGQGSCFWFTLPVDVRDTAPETLPWQAGRMQPRIVVIRPRPLAARLLDAYLSVAGCRVDICDTPEQAAGVLAALDGKGTPCHLVIAGADLAKPAWETALSPLQNASAPALAVIPSAYGQQASAGLPPGATCLSNPLKKRALFTCVAAAMGLDMPPGTEKPSGSNPGPSTPSPSGAARSGAEQPLCRVLLAEDNLVNQKVITTMLNPARFHVTTAGDGTKALEAYKTRTFDLVLMDVQMPVMGGLEATRKIREAEKEGRVPILALTANAMKGDREACLLAGMDDYLAKPVNKKSLMEKINQLLGRPQGEPM